MLRILYGKAGTGKSAAIMREIKAAVDAKRPGNLLIVPEQYSHEAERELCAVCGDSLSLYAEVLSFTGFARKMSSLLGGAAEQVLDKGGRLLCMALASDGLYARLKVYSAARKRAELQSMLLAAVTELKTACITAEQLQKAAAECGGELSDKLSDLALILEAYDAVVANGHADPTDRLSLLARQIPESGITENTHIYIDGFTDFTAQEMKIIEELLRKGAQVTVCLGCDSLRRGSEIFELSRLTARRLIRFAEDEGIGYKTEEFTETAGREKALSYFADRMFTYSGETYPGDGSAVSLCTAPDMAAECELAAAQAVKLVREKGCRFRDIAVAVRGFDDYRLPLESAFAQYGVPLYTARKSDLMSKPIPALIAGAYEILGGGWEASDVMAYLRTGLAGLDCDECDVLENYLLLWSLRGNVWTKDADWRLHPRGYGEEFDEGAETELRRINLLRRRVSAPLLRFAEKSGQEHTAVGQAQALAELLEELEVAESLRRKSEALSAEGRGAAAQETGQLWDICVSALEQCAAILGDAESDRESFGRLFTTVLNRYDVGSIPAGLDRVTAGDFDRMRRRKIKHLIVLGASDDRLPKAGDDVGMFSADERKRLLELDIDLGGAGESELWREFSLIYNCLTLPSETLTLCYPAFDAKGEPQRASFVASRAKSLFGLTVKSVTTAELRLNALSPALLLAANALRGGGTAEASAKAYFDEKEPERTEKLYRASEMSRGRLSERSVRALYGDRLRLSASRIDKFASCRFSYFMQYGLKAKKREPAGFKPSEIGTFMHYILENVARDVTEEGGFKLVTDERLNKLTAHYVEAYVHETLNDFQEKTPRFEYLFRRLVREVRQVVTDMAAELRCSDFEPLSFELDFGKESRLPPMELGTGKESLILTGIADRVDGWAHDGKLYIRVVDYKTGRKEFSLPHVWYGLGLQMLLYLFSLGKNGHLLYGNEIVPAGVLYIPARNDIISENKDISDEEIEEKRSKNVKRSGLLLNDTDVLRAMENSAAPRYIPVKFKGDVPTGKSLATAAQLGLLSEHIGTLLGEMASQLHQGSIAADPFYKNQSENACINCDYLEACLFADGENGEGRRCMPPRLTADKIWNILEGGAENV